MGPIEAEARQKSIERKARLGMLPPRKLVVARPPAPPPEPQPEPPAGPNLIDLQTERLIRAAQRIASSMHVTYAKPPLTVDAIVQAVAAFYEISATELLCRRRHNSIVRPRQIAMYLACKLTQRSMPEIGRRMSDRDHTTVLHAYRTTGKRMQTDERLKDEVELITMRLMESFGPGFVGVSRVARA